MDKQVITISEDVINNVVKPMSLFLNDVAVGAIFTHIPQPNVKEYKMTGKVHPTYKYASNKGGTYKFTTYDLRNFSTSGVKFNDYFVPQTGKKCLLATEFTVTKCEPLLIDNEKVYPLFCYAGFDEYVEEKAKLVDGAYPSEEMFVALKASGIKSGAQDRYYRTVEIDKHIFYYD